MRLPGPRSSKLSSMFCVFRKKEKNRLEEEKEKNRLEEGAGKEAAGRLLVLGFPRESEICTQSGNGVRGVEYGNIYVVGEDKFLQFLGQTRNDIPPKPCESALGRLLASPR